MLAMRGVYEEPYRVNGHRVFYSVDSRGEQIGLRTVLFGSDSSSVITGLWDDLNRDDPIPHDASPPSLRVLRGGRAPG